MWNMCLWNIYYGNSRSAQINNIISLWSAYWQCKKLKSIYFRTRKHVSCSDARFNNFFQALFKFDRNLLLYSTSIHDNYIATKSCTWHDEVATIFSHKCHDRTALVSCIYFGIDHFLTICFWVRWDSGKTYQKMSFTKWQSFRWRQCVEDIDWCSTNKYKCYICRGWWYFFDCDSSRYRRGFDNGGNLGYCHCDIGEVSSRIYNKVASRFKCQQRDQILGNTALAVITGVPILLPYIQS